MGNHNDVDELCCWRCGSKEHLGYRIKPPSVSNVNSAPLCCDCEVSFREWRNSGVTKLSPVRTRAAVASDRPKVVRRKKKKTVSKPDPIRSTSASETREEQLERLRKKFNG